MKIQQYGSVWYCVEGPARCVVSKYLDRWHITCVSTERNQRRKGYASSLFKALCTLADSEGVALSLNVAPYGSDLTRAQTALFYAKHGFIVKGRKTFMVRAPKA